MPSIGTLYASIAPDFTRLRLGVAKQLPGMEKLGKTVGGRMMLGIGAGMVAGGAIVAKQAISAAMSFEEGLATIRTGTGATGKELEALGKSARAVFKQVPDDFQVVSETLAELNRRTGATGGGLRGLTKTMLDLADVTGEEVNQLIPATTRLFGDWSIATKDQVSTLDDLFKLSQGTGIEVGRLSELMVQFGSPLRNLGIDFDFAASMFAKFEREGVNIQTAMPGLRMALKNFAADGREPGEALMETFEQIKNAPSIMKANTLAFEIFGTRAGPDMAAAIREGRFELDDLMKLMDKSPETISKADKASETLGEKWEVLKNKIDDLLVPLGQKLIPLFEDAVEWVGKAIKPSGVLGQTFDFVGRNAKTLASIVGGVLTAAIGIKLVKAFNTMKLAFMTNPFGMIAVAVTTLAVLIITNWDKIKERTIKVWDAVGGFISKTWGHIKRVTGDVLGWLIDRFADFIEFWFDFAGKVLTGAEFAFGWIPKIGPRIEKFRDDFNNTTDDIVEDFRRQADAARGWNEKTTRALVGATGEAKKFLGTLRGIGAFSAISITTNFREAGAGFAVGGTPLAMASRVMGAVPGFQAITSGYRPGDDGFHGVTPPWNAVDIGGTNLPNVYAAARAMFGRSIREMIYGHKIYEHGVERFYSPSDHFDHVHLAKHGWHGFTSKPTLFATSENSQRERVDISPMNQDSRWIIAEGAIDVNMLNETGWLRVKIREVLRQP